MVPSGPKWAPRGPKWSQVGPRDPRGPLGPPWGPQKMTESPEYSENRLCVHFDKKMIVLDRVTESEN